MIMRCCSSSSAYAGIANMLHDSRLTATRLKNKNFPRYMYSYEFYAQRENMVHNYTWI